MVTLASMFVLSEYFTSKDGQHSPGKLRVRRLKIRIVPKQFPNHCEVNVFLVSDNFSFLVSVPPSWNDSFVLFLLARELDVLLARRREVAGLCFTVL